ncbi:hypothetical protein ACVWW6_006014 [Bradyrhizobium sp. USDA 3311]
MFEGIAEFLSAWRTVVHVSEWTGLFVGALAVLGLLVYLDPRLLRPAARGLIAVGIGYAGLLVGDHIGRADVNAQWAAAREAAIAQQKQRDSDVERELEDKYAPRLAELQHQAADNKRKADGYEQKLLAAMAKDASRKPGTLGGCELGAAADRVPKRK